MNSVSKVALVTGAAPGYKNGGASIGSAIATELSKDGFTVAVVDVLHIGKLTVDRINEQGGHSIFIQGDVTDSAFVKQAVERVEKELGGLNCLVNCVARYSSGMAKNVAEITEEEWYKTLEVNLNGYFKCAKYFIPLILKSDGGTIINISSAGSFNALPNFSVYSVSKAAIDGLTRSLAVDFAPQIRTNSVCPGFVKIENSQNNRSNEELDKWYGEVSRQYPMKRVCEVEEIANAVSFLASDASSYINGQSLLVDGGKLISDSHDF